VEGGGFRVQGQGSRIKGLGRTVLILALRFHDFWFQLRV
jgi:hypothetical protein